MRHAARWGRQIGFGLALLGTLLALLLPAALRADDGTVYFSNTGHILNDDHGFLS
ncbi:MAG: murein L,D-transpeptidase, partial [Chloroflexales bacterium]|nr:murein L,D-transpeptidase [Chloroflexales bacterium]